MKTDKVLALAKEARFQLYDYGSVTVATAQMEQVEKFAALIQREMEAENAELQKLLDSAENAMAKGVALHRGDSENPADYCRCDSCTWLNRYLMHKTIRARSANEKG